MLTNEETKLRGVEIRSSVIHCRSFVVDGEHTGQSVSAYRHYMCGVGLSKAGSEPQELVVPSTDAVLAVIKLGS